MSFPCPICNKQFTEARINAHVLRCMSRQDSTDDAPGPGGGGGLGGASGLASGGSQSGLGATLPPTLQDLIDGQDDMMGLDIDFDDDNEWGDFRPRRHQRFGVRRRVGGNSSSRLAGSSSSTSPPPTGLIYVRIRSAIKLSLSRSGTAATSRFRLAPRHAHLHSAQHMDCV
jgi:hypothetical protein